MKRIALVLFLAAASLAATAFDFTGSGFSPTGEKVEDGRTFTVLDDGSGGTLLFFAEAEPSPDRIEGLKALYSAVRSWPGFEASAVRAVNSTERLQVVALPKHFVVEGVDLVPAVPSGVQLYRSVATEYDFKVKSGQYAVNVRGIYASWGELSAAILEAFRDPVAFATARDPLYALKRLAELEGRIAKLETRIAELETRMQALVSADGSSAGHFETALLAALNGDKPISDEAVAKLTALKKADPSLDKVRAAAELKAAGLTLSAKEIAAVFLVKFGER
jgi:hypothetical protein